MRLLGWMCALLLWPAAAQAEWREASSAHFVVYADDGERSLRGFADRLERYHAAMELLTRQKTPPLSPSNRLTVYVVESEEAVRSLAKLDDNGVAAFYVPRAGGSLAVVPPQGKAKAEGSELSLIALLHEYAHHFLISTSAFPMPLWFNEGAAEFFSSASFKSDGGMGLGQPANHRVDELWFAKQITARDVLDSSFDEQFGGRYIGFYAKSWQLYHYLIFEPRREGQLRRYMMDLTAGETSLDAAQKEFGDLGALEQELDEYAKRPKLSFYSIPAAGLHPGPVAVRTLTRGEAAVVQIRLRLRLGAAAEEAQELLAQARAVAAQHPSDPAVLAVLAAAEHGAGNEQEAIAAADAAIAIDPGQVEAYVQKGLALFGVAESAADAPAVYGQAREAFAELSAREPDHPLPLAYFFYSYLVQDDDPPARAMQGMQRAVELAPFDLSLRMNLALQQVRQGQTAAARANLIPVASNPHGGAMAAEARTVLAQLDAGPGGPGGDADAKKDGGSDAGAAKSLR